MKKHKIPNTQNKLIELKKIKCAVGAEALHPIYGVCKVIAANGAMRTISSPAIGEIKIRLEVRNVHVNELKELKSHATIICE